MADIGLTGRRFLVVEDEYLMRGHNRTDGFDGRESQSADAVLHIPGARQDVRG
jgi:hypothetical protein